MSQFDNILSHLKIKGIIADPSQPDATIGEFKGKSALIQHAIQSDPHAQCPDCQTRGIKYGFKMSYIQMPDYLHLSSWIFLKKQRYQCKQCGRTYLSTTNFVDKHCYISNFVKHSLIQKAKIKISVTDIAKEFHVSWPTVQREINKWCSLISRDFNDLPSVLCIDEFRVTSTLKNSKMALCLVDGHSHKILDICPDRKLSFLLKHFGQYNQQTRNQVNYSCMDMYEPYRTLARRLFPRAKVCIDKFHVVQLATTALNNCRVEVMKQTYSPIIYKTYKRFWRLPLTAMSKLDTWTTRWVPFLRTYKTQGYLLEMMLDESETLRETYEVYQSLLRAFKMNSRSLFEQLLMVDLKKLHPQMATSIRTFKRLKNEIINGIETGHTNGPMEANNNNIKVLKRIAYGYKNYNNFRNRILLVYTDKIEIAA